MRWLFDLPRGKVVGGSRAINGQVWFRGVPEDYDDWEAMGNEGCGYLDVYALLPQYRD